MTDELAKQDGKGLNVLSLFDGMSCGMIAFMGAGLPVERYVAYEIDKYAIKVSSHNFPDIEQKGDVFEADFSEYEGFDAVVGGSPCTYWSIAQTKGRETEAHGIGWELFQQYVRAVREAKPKFFIYENNKSMSNTIKEEISNTFGFEPILINSALVSAQRRQRYYWVGVRNEDGTYRKANILQPEDRGILLRDVLDEGWTVDRDKSHTIGGSQGRTTHREYFDRNQNQMALHPIRGTDDDKSRTILAQYHKNSVANFITGDFHGATGVAEPVAVRCRGRVDADGNGYAKYEASSDRKSNALDTNVTNGSMVAEPINVTDDGKSQTIKAQYHKNSVANFVGYSGTFGATGVAKPIDIDSLRAMGSVGNMYGSGQNGELFGLDSKTKTLSAGTGQTGRGIGSSNAPKAILPCSEHVPESVCARMVGRRIGEDGRRDDNNTTLDYFQRVEVNDDPDKTNCLTTVLKDNLVITPTGLTVLNVNPSGKGINGAVIHINDKSRCLTTNKGEGQKIIEPIVKAFSMVGDFDSRRTSVNDKGFCVAANPSSDMDSKVIMGERIEVRGMSFPLKETNDRSEGVIATLDMPGHHDILTRVVGTEGKSPTITSNIGGNKEPKVFSSTDRVRSTTPTPHYTVTNGMIEIKGKTYPIKLPDGEYIIRKLTVSECKRLQTVPEWYDMSVISNSQAYKCLGNGWTVDVISHLIMGATDDLNGGSCKGANERMESEGNINRLGGLYGQHTRWGVFDIDGKVPTLTASAGMGGGHLPMVPLPYDKP